MGDRAPAWHRQVAIAERVPPVIPEKHAWIDWDGVGRPMAAGRPIPATRVEWSSLDGIEWMGWEAHIPLETGVTCVLWSPYAGWNDTHGRWQWEAPSLEPRLFVPDERERLCLVGVVAEDGTGSFHQHADCKGEECVGLRGDSRRLYADEDLWMYLSEWSRWPVVGE